MNQQSGPWQPQPEGTSWVRRQIERFRGLHPSVSQLETLLRTQTGTRLCDWIDHLCVTESDGLNESGYIQESDGWYVHPGALLPPVHVGDADRMLLRVDSVVDFAVTNSSRFPVRVTGRPGDLLRVATIGDGSVKTEFGVIEHRGCNIRTWQDSATVAGRAEVEDVRESLRLRPRCFSGPDDAFDDIESRLRTSIERLGRDLTCDLFFEGERAYWLGRNHAARVQLMRQSSLGLGWGNHDHHTYRSSRIGFSRLIHLFETLGFQCRERFYAGREAGWGAQVIEQPVCGVVIFADVDLSPDEIAGDFAHEPLAPRQQLGTIGLWCALHGEALFEAGMHHLECQFDFDGARQQLEQFGIRCMKPFTDFPFLRQCFTEGERWPVRSERIQHALSSGWITQDQALRFQTEGAVGSHLEILERNDGYRGFNQTGINDIIRSTDPRHLKVG